MKVSMRAEQVAKAAQGAQKKGHRILVFRWNPYEARLSGVNAVRRILWLGLCTLYTIFTFMWLTLVKRDVMRIEQAVMKLSQDS